MSDGFRRIRGKIKLVKFDQQIFGVIDGDDGRDYFFIPSLMLHKQTYWRLEPGFTVEFMPLPTDHGFRASEITVLWTVTGTHANGEEKRVEQ